MEHGRFQTKQTQDQQADQSNQSGRTQEFNTAEEVIRFDLESVSPPGALDDRVRNSLAAADQAGSKKSWWKRLFSGGKGE